MDWEPTTLPWSRALQPGESSEAGRFTPSPQPLLSLAPRRELAQHLSVTSRKDQPPNRTTTGTRQDGSAQTCTLTQGHTHVQGAGEQVDTHLLELLSLSLVFDVTPSAKQPERSPSEGAWAGGTGAPQLSPSTTDQGQDSIGLPKNLQPSTQWDESVPHGQGRHLSPLAGSPGTCRGMLPGEAGRQEGLPGRGEGTGLPRLREGGVHREENAGRGAGAACTQRAGEGRAVLAQGRDSLPLGMRLGRTETRQ